MPEVWRLFPLDFSWPLRCQSLQTKAEELLFRTRAGKLENYTSGVADEDSADLHQLESDGLK